MSKSKPETFFDLFLETEEYPQAIAERGVPQDTLFEYVSNTFLNGFINYVKVNRAVVKQRYCVSQEEAVEGDDSLVWLSDAFEERMKPLRNEFNCEWGYAPDDVVILAETANSYWVFYYDRDCSDCMIGRAGKVRLASLGVLKDKVMELFEKELRSVERNNKGRYVDFTTYTSNGWLGG